MHQRCKHMFILCISSRNSLDMVGAECSNGEDSLLRGGVGVKPRSCQRCSTRKRSKPSSQLTNSTNYIHVYILESDDDVLKYSLCIGSCWSTCASIERTWWNPWTRDADINFLGIIFFLPTSQQVCCGEFYHLIPITSSSFPPLHAPPYWKYVIQALLEGKTMIYILPAITVFSIDTIHFSMYNVLHLCNCKVRMTGHS